MYTVHNAWNNSKFQVYEITDIVGFCPAAGTDWNPSWLDSRVQCLDFTMLLAQLLQLILERVIAVFTIPRVTHQGPSVPLNGEVLLQPRSLVLQTIRFGSDLLSDPQHDQFPSPVRLHLCHAHCKWEIEHIRTSTLFSCKGPTDPDLVFSTSTECVLKREGHDFHPFPICILIAEGFH